MPLIFQHNVAKTSQKTGLFLSPSEWGYFLGHHIAKLLELDKITEIYIFMRNIHGDKMFQ